MWAGLVESPGASESREDPHRDSWTRGLLDSWSLKERAFWRVELVPTPVVVTYLDLEAVGSAVKDMDVQLRYHHGNCGVVEVLVHLNHLQGLHDLAEEDVVELDTSSVSKLLLVLQGLGILDTQFILWMNAV